MNPALRIHGPAVLTYKGVTFASKGDIGVNPINTTFDLQSDAYGVLEPRGGGQAVSLTFTPVGAWDNLTVLWPAALQVIGGLTTPKRTFLPAAVVTADNQVTITAHGWDHGAAVRVFTFGTMPAGLTAGDLYYLRAVNANTVSFHPTRADAIAGTNAVDITTAGTVKHVVIEQEPLVVVSIDGERYTFHVAALNGLPEIAGTARDTLIGQVTFDCFRKAGVPATTANSLYTLDDAAYTPPEIDASDILTQGYLLSWGAAPWADLETVGGIRFQPSVTLGDVTDDAGGVTARRVDNVGVIVRAQPLGLLPSVVMDKVKLQGAGSAVGASLATTDNLVMAGDGVQVSITNAALIGAPQTFGRNADRIGELEWRATRKFDAGVPQPLFAVGTGA